MNDRFGRSWNSMCETHAPMFARLFEPNDRNGDNWLVTSYARRVALSGDPDCDRRSEQRRSHRECRRRRGCYLGSLELGDNCDVDDDDDDCYYSTSDPRRDAIVFAATNPKLFTTGGSRSVASVYAALWRRIYNERSYASCECSEQMERARIVHVARDVATFAWRPFGDTVARYAFAEVEDLAQRATVSAVPRTRRSLARARLLESPLALSHLVVDPYSVEWTCDVSVTFPSETPLRPVKLLDRRFESAKEAWLFVVDIVEWCERTADAIALYPVRRSVWDMLFQRRNGRWLATSGCGLVDIGDESAYAHTLRVLMLAIYLGCSYGGMARAASANDRVSNRSHDCALPPKTSGIYHALFHTSVLPHRLLCSVAGTRRKRALDGDHLPRLNAGAFTATATTTTATTTTTTDNRALTSLPEEWIRCFYGLCDKACDRYGLDRPWRREYDDQPR